MPWAVALGLLLGGALGNLVDRLLRAPGPGRGHVVDFIDYFGLFIGNVADVAIVAGAGHHHGPRLPRHVGRGSGPPSRARG